MPTLDTAAEIALDEAIGLCLDPVGRHAGLVRWLADHPGLAGALAEDLSACDDVEKWMSPVRSESLPPPDHRTATFGGTAGTPAQQGAAGGDSVSLEFGDFDLLEELGRGGMGVVYKARHKKLNKVVALKTILAGGFLSARDVGRLRFEAERQALALMDHPNIVPIYGAGEHDGLPFFSMKLVAGGTLADRLDEFRRDLDLKAAARLLAKVARAVHYAHQRGIVHRDLKPGNILLDGPGPATAEPLVADFGLAKLTDAAGAITASGGVVGTPVYMSPEQARGERGVTTASDVYSLGAILYQLLTGRPPFAGATTYEILQKVIDQIPENPITLNPAAPPDLVAVCLKCLEKKPEHRYASAGDLAADLEAFAAGRSVSVRPRSAWSRLSGALRGKKEFYKLSESWFAFAVRAASLMAVTHATLFCLIAGGGRMAWVWAVLVPYFVYSGTVRVRMLLRAAAYDPWEHLAIVIFTGQTLCIIALALAMLPFDPDAPAEALLVWYPPLALIFALGMFVQGTSSLGIHYPASVLYILLAVALRFCGTAAPLVFLTVHATMLLFLTFATLRAHTNALKMSDGADPVRSAPTISKG